ncbi:Guanosine nucleotide diphosphate dissociation inhibitor [Fasciolopsis buskii]|uniref:Rab GDP dissociation inhibitor n=1 Tax=Fasciolopsis buskii TaxID=27845 RepID=A0A8E0VI53_9TREM|nr:Guanosine nucleotide diphosphate dissociation inhibitor [Fasciolopsis buski]
MDEEYDVVVLGTGLKECILSGLMSIEGKKVLHMDRNDYYGGKSTSVTPLNSLFSYFKVSGDTEKFGTGKEWNVDLIPKFLMSNGNLVALLIHTGVLRYLEFKQIEGSYVYQNGGIHKVPCDEAEALSSNLMGLFEKRRFRKLLVWVMNIRAENPETWNDVYQPPKDIARDSIMHAFEHFEISEDTQTFVGHAICLYPDELYKEKVPALEVIQRMQLYSQSVCRYGKSPYVYPLYGLGELPQAFARLSAVHGGTYMLHKPIDEIVIENGHVIGVKAEGEVARCKLVICDPTYAPDRVKKIGKVVRAICLLNHPIPGVHNAMSCQVIIPQKETQRHHDVYISCVSRPHMVCPENFYVVLVATTVETKNPHDELKPGLDLLGSIEQVFYSVEDLFEPLDDGRSSKIFISSSYDASTHFESTCEDVLNLYERITGQPFDFSKVSEKMKKWKEEV